MYNASQFCIFLNKALGDKGSIPESFVKQRSTTRQMIMHEIAFCTDSQNIRVVQPTATLICNKVQYRRVEREQVIEWKSSEKLDLWND